MGSTDLQGAVWDAGIPWWLMTKALDDAYDRGHRAGVRAERTRAMPELAARFKAGLAAGRAAPDLSELARIAAGANGRRSA